MKKGIVLLVILMLLGCQKKAEVLKLENNSTINEVQLEIIKTQSLDILQPSNKNKNKSKKYAQDNYVFIDLLLKITNLSQKQLKIDDIFKGTFQIGTNIYDLESTMETVDYTRLTTTDTIKENEERYVHLYCEVPKEEATKKICLNLQLFHEKEYQYQFSIDQDIQKENYQSVGDVLSLNKSQISLNQIGESKKIEPSHKGLFYSYIPTDHENETFVYIQTDIHNISDQTLYLEDYIYCECQINDNIIKSEIIIESENHKSLEKAGSIPSLQARTVYLCIPLEDNQLTEERSIQIFVEGHTFKMNQE